MITLEAVTYRYPGAPRPALRGVTLHLAGGEVVGLAGANGAGKSTLCLVAAGLAPRVVGGTLAGRVLMDGVDTADRPIHQLVSEVTAGFQDPATQLSGIAETVYEEVAFGPSNLGVPRAELVERTEEALEALGIEALAARHPTRLSGGQQQLVAIASLLAMRARHLVLDEPTSRLDPHGLRLVADAVARLSDRGIAVLLAEHRTDLLSAACSRVVVLDAGTVALDAPAAEALADERLVSLGVAEPAAVRLRRLARESGLALDSLPDDVLRGAEEAAT